jgi:hypothetical protein
MTMATSWEEGDFIWDNIFDYLDAKEVGRCTTMSSHINECAQRHFKPVPTIVQVVQPNARGKARWELPLDGNQGVKRCRLSQPRKTIFTTILNDFLRFESK